MKQKHSVTIEELGITISTGSIARLANGAVTISKGETTLFVSATAAEELRSPDQDFFPLTVDYREKFAAAGRFPGSYFRREGKPSDKEILTSRLCDRPLRPLFPEGFLNEVQVIGLLLSADQINDSDVLMVNGASAALSAPTSLGTVRLRASASVASPGSSSSTRPTNSSTSPTWTSSTSAMRAT
ncbi:polyribonucleotide nucleotidyltransferase [Verrucomicrobiota bacterium]|nr:polyribonucleotide nucleotidyltransferase [Verrucomicrobiota bacterium]